MAKGDINTDSLAREIIEDAKKGNFKPVYLLIGEEPYYIDMVTDAIVEYALTESERDFNQTICYGADVSADDIITNARRYPMFAERQLVVVKDAQKMKALEDLAIYFSNPLESTVLVIAMRGVKADKRRIFYKAAAKVGVVLESEPLKDYEMPNWIVSFYRREGLSIDPDAAALLAEYAGTDLNKIAIETQKMLKNLPLGTKKISIQDIEKNVGISRQFSNFELTKALSYKNSTKALKIAFYIGSEARFALPNVIGALYTHFYRILKYGALLISNPRPSREEKIAMLGINPFFLSEYDLAAKNYPLMKVMAVIALLKEYDYKGKGGDGGNINPAELLTELTSKILNI